MKSNELASLIPEVFQGQNELAKEQQACALAIGDVDADVRPNNK